MYTLDVYYAANFLLLASCYLMSFDNNIVLYIISKTPINWNEYIKNRSG
jgi:hypothetical protein